MHGTQHKYKQKNIKNVKIVRNTKDDDNPSCNVA